MSYFPRYHLRFASFLTVFGIVGMAESLTAQKVVYVPIPIGIALNVITKDSLSTQVSKKGQKLNLSIEEDVVLGGHKIIAKGAPIWGTVGEVKKAGRFGSDGALNILIDSAQLIDGKKVQLVANLYALSDPQAGNGDDDKDNAAEKVVNQLPGGDLATGFFKKGDAMSVAVGSKIPTYTSSYAYLTIIDSTDTTASVDEEDSESPAARAFSLLDGIETWGRALGTVAATKGSTPQLRALGAKMMTDHAKLQDDLRVVAKDQKVALGPLVPADQESLNKSIKDLMATKQQDLDNAIIQKIYGLSENVLNQYEDGAGPGLDKFLEDASKIWADQLAAVAKLNGASGKKSK